jgi:hypothetical protein
MTFYVFVPQPTQSRADRAAGFRSQQCFVQVEAVRCQFGRKLPLGRTWDERTVEAHNENRAAAERLHRCFKWEKAHFELALRLESQKHAYLRSLPKSTVTKET